jgi:gamma-glutamyltranspeptidase/glutathione hydrolase
LNSRRTLAARWRVIPFRLAVAVGALICGAAQAAAPLAAESTTGMVVSAQHLASEVGAGILRNGGNAIDAAVAVGYALAVTHPCCGNLGGGGFMIIHLADGKDTFLNFREKAPQAATWNMFLDSAGNAIAEKSLNGFLAAGVPGTVLGLETAREKYGTLPRATLLAPAIRLGRTGFRPHPWRRRRARGRNRRISQPTQRCRRVPESRRPIQARRSADATGARRHAPSHQ